MDLLTQEARKEIAKRFAGRSQPLLVTPTHNGFTKKDGSNMTDLDMLDHIFRNRIYVDLILKDL